MEEAEILKSRSLSNSEIFKGCGRAEIAQLVELSSVQVKTFQRDQSVYVAGEPCKHVYVVMSGSVSLTRSNTGDGTPFDKEERKKSFHRCRLYTVVTLTAGASFGEEALAGQKTYTFNAQALSLSDLLCIPMTEIARLGRFAKRRVRSLASSLRDRRQTQAGNFLDTDILRPPAPPQAHKQLTDSVSATRSSDIMIAHGRRIKSAKSQTDGPKSSATIQRHVRITAPKFKPSLTYPNQLINPTVVERREINPKVDYNPMSRHSIDMGASQFRRCYELKSNSSRRKANDREIALDSNIVHQLMESQTKSGSHEESSEKAEVLGNFKRSSSAPRSGQYMHAGTRLRAATNFIVDAQELQPIASSQTSTSASHLAEAVLAPALGSKSTMKFARELSGDFRRDMREVLQDMHVGTSWNVKITAPDLKCSNGQKHEIDAQTNPEIKNLKGSEEEGHEYTGPICFAFASEGEDGGFVENNDRVSSVGDLRVARLQKTCVVGKETETETGSGTFPRESLVPKFITTESSDETTTIGPKPSDENYQIKLSNGDENLDDGLPRPIDLTSFSGFPNEASEIKVMENEPMRNEALENEALEITVGISEHEKAREGDDTTVSLFAPALEPRLGEESLITAAAENCRMEQEESKTDSLNFDSSPQSVDSKQRFVDFGPRFLDPGPQFVHSSQRLVDLYRETKSDTDSLFDFGDDHFQVETPTNTPVNRDCGREEEVNDSGKEYENLRVQEMEEFNTRKIDQEGLGTEFDFGVVSEEARRVSDSPVVIPSSPSPIESLKYSSKLLDSAVGSRLDIDCDDRIFEVGVDERSRIHANSEEENQPAPVNRLQDDSSFPATVKKEGEECANKCAKVKAENEVLNPDIIGHVRYKVNNLTNVQPKYPTTESWIPTGMIRGSHWMSASNPKNSHTFWESVSSPVDRNIQKYTGGVFQPTSALSASDSSLFLFPKKKPGRRSVHSRIDEPAKLHVPPKLRPQPPTNPRPQIRLSHPNLVIKLPRKEVCDSDGDTQRTLSARDYQSVRVNSNAPRAQSGRFAVSNLDENSLVLCFAQIKETSV